MPVARSPGIDASPWRPSSPWRWGSAPTPVFSASSTASSSGRSAYRDADRLALVEAERDLRGAREPVRAYFALTELDTFRQRSSSFESVDFYATDEGVLSNDSGIERVDFAIVSDTFFSTLRGGFRLGRPLGPSDDTAPSVVISERLWRRLFGGSFDVLGQRVVLHSQRGDGTQRAMWRRQPFTIVGVADDTLQFPTPRTDVWTTAGFVRTLNPQCCSFLPLVRLRPGATLDQASADADRGRARVERQPPGRRPESASRAVGLHEQLVRAVRPSLLDSAGGGRPRAVCRLRQRHESGAGPQRRASARDGGSPGARASRGRLVAQSIVESGLLAAAGGTAGYWSRRESSRRSGASQPAGRPPARRRAGRCADSALCLRVCGADRAGDRCAAGAAVAAMPPRP